MDAARAQRIFSDLQGVSVGGWIVSRYIGHGGSAVVLEGRRGGVVSALKLIDPELVERFGKERQIARIRREGELIAHDNPYLVKIYDANVCLETDYLYVAMELLETPTLTDLIPDFPRDKILPILEQVAHAAKYLEAKNFAHRDIKPDNVSITADYKTAKLLDLGIIRPVLIENTGNVTEDAFIGTTRYSSPEYLTREGDGDSPCRWRSLTFYQLGALLHDMIMRRPLFHDIDHPRTRLTDAVRYTTPAIECAEVHPRLVSLAKCCLHKNWRLRLNLVTWDAFSTNPRAIDARSAKQRVLDRVEAGRGSAAEPETPVAVRSQRSVVAGIRAHMANTIHQSCTESGAFPPIAINDLGDPDQPWLIMRAGPSQQHALADVLIVGFLLEVLDETGVYVRISAVSALGESQFHAEMPELLQVYSGEVTSPQLRSEVDSYMFLAFDHAQRSITHRESNVLSLEVPQ